MELPNHFFALLPRLHFYTQDCTSPPICFSTQVRCGWVRERVDGVLTSMNTEILLRIVAHAQVGHNQQVNRQVEVALSL